MAPHSKPAAIWYNVPLRLPENLENAMKTWDTVAIVGVGLIGGSVGLALRQRQLAKNVVGIGRRQASLRVARRVGAVTHTTIDLNKGVAEADLVVVCTPVGQIVEHVRQAAQHCPERTLITDAGSTKQSIVAALDGGLGHGCRFLGSHPLAGSEKTGATYCLGRFVRGPPWRSLRPPRTPGPRISISWSSFGSRSGRSS